MSRLVKCPQCQKDTVLRVWPQSPREYIASWLGIAPFSCQSCCHRFLASGFRTQQSTPLLERREHLRIPVRLYLSFSGGRVKGEGTVLDLSMGGCIIKSETQVHLEDIFYLEIAIARDEAPVEVAAMVRSVSARGIAFKFLRKAQENKRLLGFIQTSLGAPPGVPAKPFPQTVSS
jgi:hypothetical protein